MDKRAGMLWLQAVAGVALGLGVAACGSDPSGDPPGYDCETDAACNTGGKVNGTCTLATHTCAYPPVEIYAGAVGLGGGRGTAVPRKLDGNLVLPIGMQGAPYEVRLYATGGDGVYVWAPACTGCGDELVPGISVTSTGAVVGTPSATAAETCVTVGVSSAGTSAVETYCLRVADRTPNTMEPSAPISAGGVVILPDGVVDQAYKDPSTGKDLVISFGGGGRPGYMVEFLPVNGGSTPFGMVGSSSEDAAGGYFTLLGMPFSAGTWVFTLYGSDAIYESARLVDTEALTYVERSFSITVLDCGDAAAVPAACAADVANACTCGMADPCGWRGDGTCDSQCSAFYGHFDDGVDCATRVAFATSVSGGWDLGAWTDAGGQTGLAAADAICAARAAAGGLTGAFVAWASDSASDAYCRVHGLSGKRVDRCGLSALPTGAGPWARTDGGPYRLAFDAMGSSRILTPLQYDEYATPVSGLSDDIGAWILTNTVSEGYGYAGSCGDWTGAAGGYSMYGSSNAIGTSGGQAGCPGPSGRLACLQVGAGGALPEFASAGKHVFVTSATGSANLSTWAAAGGQTGLAAGDAICRSLASDAGLANPLTYKAWLSDATTDAASRVTGTGPWVRMDGLQLAADRADLLDGALFTGIAVTETGSGGGDGFVATGTATNGTRTGSTCAGWTVADTTENGTLGRETFAGSRWTNQGYMGCNYTYRLYCFEDP